MNLFKSKQLWVLALLLGMVAARPWDTLNHQIGLEPDRVDSLALTSADTLFTQPTPMIIQLPPAAVDTLSLRMAQRDSVEQAYKKQLKDTDSRIMSLQKKLKRKQQDLVSLEEIHAMTEKQRNGPEP